MASIPVEGERVWGATARMLGQLGAVLAMAAPAAGRPRAPQSAAPTAAQSKHSPPDDPRPVIRKADPVDEVSIAAFLDEMAPELARSLPPATELLVAEIAGRVVGLASWAPWDRPRTETDPRGFEGLSTEPGDCPAELTLLAVAPDSRSRGIGRDLTEATIAAVRASGCTRLLAWTLADAACHRSSIAARAFFHAHGFVDLAVDRNLQARGEDRLLLVRTLDR